MAETNKRTNFAHEFESETTFFLIISLNKELIMTYSHEVEHMCVVKKGPNHGPAPIPEEGKWVKSKEIVDISGLTHGVG